MIHETKLEAFHNRSTGTIALQVHREEFDDDGQLIRRLDPIALTEDSETFGKFATTFSASTNEQLAAVTAERDELKTAAESHEQAIATLTAERDAAISQTPDSANEQIATLTQQLTETRAAKDEISSELETIYATFAERPVVQEIRKQQAIAAAEQKRIAAEQEKERIENGTPDEQLTPAQQKAKAIRQADIDHRQRLANGIEYAGKRYPCLADDRDGINAVLASFDLADGLFNAWIAENGPPQTAEETSAMIESGAIPPEYRQTAFEWTDGQFLILTPDTAARVAGIMSLVVSRSFIDKAQRIAEIEAEYAA